MSDFDALSELVDAAATAEGDRYPQLVAAHDAIREALAQTDGDPQAAGR